MMGIATTRIISGFGGLGKKLSRLFVEFSDGFVCTAVVGADGDQRATA